MHLSALRIQNFRALEDIRVEFDNRVNVIVGPNAIGKTSVLEAIRLTKALLFPRTQNESMQALFALGASSPHLPQQLHLDAIARDPHRPTVISCRYQLSDEETSWLKQQQHQLAMQLVRSRMGQSFANASTFIAFVASEQGKREVAQAQDEISRSLDSIAALGNRCNIEVSFSEQQGANSSGDSVANTLLAALDQRHPPNRTIFSYFPADRALPAGEQPVQLGAADAAAQIESHNSQPQTKYARLKNMIFGALVMSDTDRTQLLNEFGRIFSGILRGRKLVGVGINEIGFLSIKIQDTETGRTFDLDGMSSGEKGLILTFLLIELSVVQDGLILLDEPELHLNPLVCRELLGFIVDSYAVRKNLQAIICSHSPEILAGAFDRDECSLYHLVSETMLTKVRRQDQVSVAEALRHLGTSESEGLLYKGTIFVEGPDDVGLLEAGFGSLLRRYKVKDLGGRNEVEKQIALLQEAELKGEQLPPRYFIFDRDDAPSNLKSSQSIKVLQWDRRCLENYLIDVDVLTDLLTNKEIVKTPLANQGEVIRALYDLAFEQLDEVVAKQVYGQYRYASPGMRLNEVQGKSLEQISETLLARLLSIKDQVNQIDPTSWTNEFRGRCEEEKRRLEQIWEAKWQTLCDGKRLFHDLSHRLTLNMNSKRFKLRVIGTMRETPPSENWRSVESLLKDLLGSNL